MESTINIIAQATESPLVSLTGLNLNGSLSNGGTQNLVVLTTDGTSSFIIDASQLSLFQSSDSFLQSAEALNPEDVAPTELVKQTDVQVSIAASEVPAIQENKSNSLLKKNNTLPGGFVDEIQPPIKKGPFKCENCTQEFSKYGQYLRHQKLHLDDKPFRCKECDICFNVESNLILHSATHVKDNPVCPECGKKFNRMASLKAHIMLHEKEENIICLECGEEFSTQRHMDKHKKQHQEEATTGRFYPCRHCPLKFTKATALRDHVRIHVKIRASLHHRAHKKNIDRSSFPHKCHDCGKVFQKPSQLLRHKRIHTGERPFKCDICDKAFNQKGALQIHRTKHSGEKPFVCEFCPATFSQRGNLRNHIQRVHTLSLEPNQTRFQCVECSCVFRKVGNLNAHMSKMHSSYSPIVDAKNVVEEGEQVIRQLMNLSQYTTNRDDKNKENEARVENSDILRQALENSGLTSEPKTANESYKNDVERDLVQSESNNIPDNSSTPMIMQVADYATGVMKKHIIKKIGGVVFHVCLYCGKSFRKPSDLVRHIRIHTHERPYKCENCFRAFAVASTLRAHKKVHLGIKDFCCEICKKYFSTHGSLKVHTRLHTGSKPFTCPICSKTFRTSGHRKSHMASHNQKNTTRKFKKEKGLLIKEKRSSYASLPLQEPILITDAGLVQPLPKNSETAKNKELFKGERRYQCPSCTRAFRKSSHLKQHIRSHTGEKPYNCLQCNRNFVSSGALKAHFITHTGIKKFKCNICNATFSTNGSLKRHNTTHSSARPFLCPYCEKTFKTKLDCKKHMKTHKPRLTISTDNMSNIAIQPDEEEVEPPKDQTGLNENNEEGPENGNEPQMDVEISKESYVEISTIETGFEAIVNAENNGDPMPLVSLAPEATVTLDTQTYANQHIISQAIRNSFPEQFDENEENVDSPELDQNQFMAQFATGNFTIVPPDQIDMNGMSPGHNFSMNNPTLASANYETILPTKGSENDVRTFLASTVEDLNSHTQEEVEHLDSTSPSKLEVRSIKYRCDICGKCMKKRSHLQQHLRVHSGEKPYDCQICEKKFSTTSVLNAHLKTHTGIKDFVCQQCNQAFTTNASLTRHQQIHSSICNYACSDCGNAFRNKVQYYRHRKSHKKGKDGEAPDKKKKSNLLKLSSEQADEIAKLTPSESASVSEKVLIASAAEKDRISQVKDKYLELQKLPQFAHQCTRCPKSFKKPSDLVRHVRTHTGEKPYKCDLCKKSFTVKSTLDCHYKTHSGEKNFACHVCNTFFATKGSLKVHMRLHTGAKPFQCSFCDLRFRTSGHRKSHISSHFRQNYRKRVMDQLVQRKLEPELEQNSSNMKSSIETALFESSVEEDDLTGAKSVSVENASESSQTLPIVQSVDGLQLQIPPSLLGQNIQITGIDPSLFQIEPKFLQQFQGGNINITISPSIITETNAEDNEASASIDNGSQFLQTLSGGSLVSLNASLIQQLNSLGLSLDQAQLIASINDGSVQNATNVPFHITIDNGDKHLVENQEVNDNDEPVVNEDLELDLDDGIQIGEGELIDNMLKDIRPPRREKEAGHQCASCGKGFQRRSLLERHERIHTGERPFKCNLCEKAFNQKNTLIIHQKKHSGEKPFACGYCAMQFSQKGNLRTHQKRAHPGNPELYRIVTDRTITD